MSHDLFGLNAAEQAALFAGLHKSKRPDEALQEAAPSVKTSESVKLQLQAFADFPSLEALSKKRTQKSTMETRIDPKWTRFEEMTAYKKLTIERQVARQARIFNPFFLCHETAVGSHTVIDGKDFLNFSSYDYLGLGSTPEVRAAARDAVDRWGTSAGASRLVAGEKTIHRELEEALARHYGSEDALCYVSGHATNVSTISQLFGPRDVIFHDALAHNSIVLGAKFSGAKRFSYPHNDMQALDAMLKRSRSAGERCLIATEGVFSMDGNIADLPRLVELKKKYGAFLLVDEAHALGVLGASGRGTFEHFGMDSRDVDIWMGTLSKTLCACGGYIAGNRALIDILKFHSPSFVYSVGLSPVLAAASLAALRLLEKSAQRTAHLRALSDTMIREARALGLNTGKSKGTAIVPIIIGNSILAGMLAQRLFQRGLNVLPIIYPVVEEGAARLRFFLSAAHTENDVLFAVRSVAEELEAAQSDLEAFTGSGAADSKEAASLEGAA